MLGRFNADIQAKSKHLACLASVSLARQVDSDSEISYKKGKE
jgi:hypothetical protein